MNMYKLLVDSIGDSLKAQGFEKRGDTFYFFRNNNWGLITFQKSRKSISDSIVFTINIGVSSTSLRKYLDQKSISDKPKIEECHWRLRIGSLMPQKKDYWWKIDTSTSFDTFKVEITDTINNYGINYLRTHISDEMLMMEWLKGISEGITEFERYIFLTTLLKLNKNDMLDLVIDEFKAYAIKRGDENSVNEHIRVLEAF